MRRVVAIVGLCLGFLVSSAIPASAQWEWFKWIQELSGPGPFEMDGVTLTFGCQYTRGSGTKGERQPEIDSSLGERPQFYKWVFCDRVPHNWRNVNRFFGFSYMTGSGQNNLEFPAGRERLERVTAATYLVRGAKRLHEFADIGAQVGFLRLTATPEITVSRYLIDPYIAFRPLGRISAGSPSTIRGRVPKGVAAKDALARGFDIVVGALIFPQGFRVSDFGATGGPDLRGKAELSWHAGVRFVVF